MDSSSKIEDGEKNVTTLKKKTNNFRQYKKSKNDTSVIETPRFIGMCTALSEYTYDCSGNGQAEQYSKTTEKIAEYVGTEYTMGSNIRTAIETLTTSTLTMPIEPGANASRTETFMWQENVKIYMRKIDQLSESTKKTYSLVWGQCSRAMRSRVEEVVEFPDILSHFDPIRLLTEIKLIAFNVQSHQHLPVAMYKTLRSFMLCRQGRNDSVQTYYETFRSHIQVVEEASGGIAAGNKLYDIEIDKIVPAGNTGNYTIAQKRTAKATARENYLAVCFIMGSDKSRYWKYLEDLENDFLKGRDDYPITLNDAYRVLSNYKTANSSGRPSAGKDGVAFVLDGVELSEEQISLVNTEGGNDDEDAVARRKRNLKFMKCYNCGKRGHLARDCRSPSLKQDTDNDNVSTNPNSSNTNIGNNNATPPSTTSIRQTGTTSLMAAAERG